jgi:hypothetical protein
MVKGLRRELQGQKKEIEDGRESEEQAEVLKKATSKNHTGTELVRNLDIAINALSRKIDQPTFSIQITTNSIQRSQQVLYASALRGPLRSLIESSKMIKTSLNSSE